MANRSQKRARSPPAFRPEWAGMGVMNSSENLLNLVMIKYLATAPRQRTWPPASKHRKTKTRNKTFDISYSSSSRNKSRSKQAYVQPRPAVQYLAREAPPLASQEPGIIKILKPSAKRWDQGIPQSCVEAVPAKIKAKLFEGSLPISAVEEKEAMRLLARLSDLHVNAGGNFDLKHGELNDLMFRLIFAEPQKVKPLRRLSPVGRTRSIEGYYALSYRWASRARETNNETMCSRRRWNAAANMTTTPTTTTSTRTSTMAAMMQQNMELPTSDDMFRAIIDELPSDGKYGLWVDQICIDEAHAGERKRSVSMMDAIYRSAAKVIIALDDIEITDPAELHALLEFEAWHDHHMSEGRVPEDEDFSYVKQRPALRACIERIIYSEYFDRAWCAHEFELANDRLVLIRAGRAASASLDDGSNGNGGESAQRIVRISNSKLHTLMLLLSLDTKASISPAQAARRVNVELLISRSDRDDPATRSQMVHDMQTLALINGMASGGDPTLSAVDRPFSAIRDKVSIMLNAFEYNLQPGERFLPITTPSASSSAASSFNFSDDTTMTTTTSTLTTTTNATTTMNTTTSKENTPTPTTMTGTTTAAAESQRANTLAEANTWTYQQLSLLMLAAGNPLILATTGKPIRVSDTQESWMRRYWLLDAGIESSLPPLSFPLRISVDPSPHCLWIRLSLLFPASGGGELHVASDKYLRQAEAFVRDFYDTHRSDILDDNQALLKRRLEHFTHLIACHLECSCHNDKGKDPLATGDGEANKPWRYFFGDALDQLPAKIQAPRRPSSHTRPVGMDLKFDGRDESPASIRGSSRSRSGTPTVGDQPSAMELAGELMSDLLMSAPMPESRGDSAAWRPAWFEAGDGARFIVMAPRAPGRYRVAVPEVLKTAPYAELARCWIVEEREASGSLGSGHWVVRNRSKLMMNDDTLELDGTDGSWRCLDDQTVWGRTIDVTQESD